jgi:hypothetical protein
VGVRQRQTLIREKSSELTGPWRSLLGRGQGEIVIICATTEEQLPPANAPGAHATPSTDQLSRALLDRRGSRRRVINANNSGS